MSLPVAEQGCAVAFAVLPTAIDEGALAAALPLLESLTELIEAEGGKRYLSGWIGNPSVEFWRRHFGSRYEDWISAKRTHDPGGVLSSVLFSQLDAELYARGKSS